LITNALPVAFTVECSSASPTKFVAGRKPKFREKRSRSGTQDALQFNRFSGKLHVWRGTWGKNISNTLLDIAFVTLYFANILSID
jgi:hypothetical protein